MDKANAAIRGGDNNLYVAIAKYQPKVQCDKTSKPPPPWRSCIHIWGDMQAGQERQVFGRGSDPNIQVKLPFVLKASKYSPVRQAANCVQSLE